MKYISKSFIIALILSVGFALQMQAQSRAKYSSLIGQGKFDEAITEGITVKNRLRDLGDFKAMFEMMRDMEANIAEYEKTSGKQQWKLRYRVMKERMLVYLSWNMSAKTKEYLDALETMANHFTDEKDKEEWLLTKAMYYNKFGPVEKCADCYRSILAHRRAGKSLNETDKVFKDIMELAKKNNHTSVKGHLATMYQSWQDSIAMQKITEELHNVQKQYAESQNELEDRDSSITGLKASLWTISFVAIALAGALVFILLLWIRGRMVINRLEKSLAIANDNNELKSEFIANVSNRLQPMLDDKNGMENLLRDIEMYFEQENNRDKRFEIHEVNLGKLCESIMSEVKSQIPANVEATVSCSSMLFKTNPEVVSDILSFIIKATSRQPGSTSITLDFKKRSAHSGEFVLTNIGGTLSEGCRDTIFAALKGDNCPGDSTGLGYPICSLKAFRMDANLVLDNEFKKGTRFLLKVKE